MLLHSKSVSSTHCKLKKGLAKFCKASCDINNYYSTMSGDETGVSGRTSKDSKDSKGSSDSNDGVSTNLQAPSQFSFGPSSVSSTSKRQIFMKYVGSPRVDARSLVFPFCAV